MSIKKNLLLAAMGLVMVAATATGASAETRWDLNHPRRTEVNHRLTHESHRIHVARREGLINGRQAHRLHVADRRIRHQERVYAMNHGGHISRAEQHRLNREENRVGRHIPG
jgi:hypothetical protein